MGSGESGGSERHVLYDTAAREYGRALDRLAAGYEADPDKRRDLRQEIHFQLWRSLEVFDGRCSLKTWTFRVAHNTAATWVGRERRRNATLISLEELGSTPAISPEEPDIDRQRALELLSGLIRRLKPLDRQIMISWLEGLDGPAIAEITGLSPANVGMKVHRIKAALSAAFAQENRHVR